jgi:transglutaminase-like putative cysteine protease
MIINRKFTIAAAITFNLIFLFTTSAYSICPHNFSERILDISHIQEVSHRVTLQKFPNADYVNIDQKHWISYNSDGTYEEWNAHAVKILTEKGRRLFQTISSYFTIPYNTTSFKHIEIIRSDGSRIPVDIEKNSRITIEHGQMKNNIYNPNQKILRVSIPKLEIGDTLYTELMDHFSKVRTPGTWSDYVGMESEQPIIRAVYEVCAPIEKPLEKIMIKNEIPGTITFEEKRNAQSIIYKWTAQNVPQAFPEPDMPPMYSQMQRLLISTVKDWKEISQWYWELCKDPINDTTSQMEKMVQQLIQDVPNEMEKIEKIFYWVSQKIRYLGLTVEKEAPGYEPHPVKMTFERRAGVCRDKAALLVSMLRLANFEAYPVLIMNGPKKDPEVPQPFFNHAVSCVWTDDGKYILMDATDENTRALFPTYLNDQSYLVARPDGDHLRTSPIAQADDNMMVIQTKGQINDNGHLSAECELRFEGINDNAYRGYFSRISFDERKTFLENLVKNIAPGAKLVNFTILPKDMLRTDEPLTIQIHFNAPDLRIQESDTIMLPVFQVGTRIGIVRHLIGKMGLKKRKYPLKTNYACGVKEHLDLKLNDSVGQLIRAPSFSPIDNEGVTYNKSMSVKNNHLTGDYVFQLKKPEYPPDEYKELLKSLETIEQNNKKVPIFDSFSSISSSQEKWYDTCSPDAIVLSETVHYDIQSHNQWTERRKIRLKILTYAGKKRFSDVQIPYHPPWEIIHIQDASVMLKDGSSTPINPDEINTMDAPWSGDAPRYPSAKTLVVSFPGVDIDHVIAYTVIHKIKSRPFFSNLVVWPIPTGLHQLSEYPIQRINSYFRYRIPIAKKCLIFTFPKDLDIQFQKHPKGIGKLFKTEHPVDIHMHLKHDKNTITYQYEAEKILPVKSEQFLPPWYSFNPVVTATTETWQNFAQNLYARMIMASLSQKQTRKKARALTKELQTPMAKIKAIRDFIVSHIRLIPIDVNNIDINHLSGADITLQDGYGHPIDRAIVFYAMARNAGFSPEFVLVSSTTTEPVFFNAFKEIISPQWFQNVLVRVNIDRQSIYLNDTDQYAEIGVTRYQGRNALVLPDGTIETILPRTLKYQSNSIEKYTVALNPSGAATITQTCEYFGMTHAQFNKNIAEMPPEKRNRYHLQQVARISQAAEILSPYQTNIQEYPATEQFSVTVNPYAVRDRNYIYLEIPGFSKGMAGVRKDKRSHPLYRPFFSRKEVYVEIITPSNFHSVITPKNSNLTFDSNTLISMHTTKDQSDHAQKICTSQHIDIAPMLIDADDYDDFLNIHHQLNHMASRMLLFEIKNN